MPTTTCRLYLEWLAQYAQDSGRAIHAYVLMTNHAQLLLTPADADSAGRLMKRQGQRYVQYVNRSYRRSGTLYGRDGTAPALPRTWEDAAREHGGD